MAAPAGTREHPRTSPATREPDNDELAEVLEEIAALLEVRGEHADGHRARAYREGARTLRGLRREAATIAREGGEAALAELPAIGEGIARVIAEFVSTGRVGVLERLTAGRGPEGLFATIPGIGPELAGRIHDHLGAETLEALEVAAHDGRLEDVPGIGPRRARGVREALGGMLGRSPRRFNPEGEAWLPVWRTERGGWRFDVLFSNTATAHELGKTREWVVIYYAREGAPGEGQCTVVTETKGERAGERVVRGRERG